MLLCLVCIYNQTQGQNETSKWYFGSAAGINFMTNPPTSIPGNVTTVEGCSSIADAAGNMLLSTDGQEVWQYSSLILPSGLAGNFSSTQSALLVKQPGNNNIYFIFTVDDQGGPDGLTYSVVDVSLAAGVGSVTSLNNPVYTPSCEKLTAVKHCNGVDVWVLSHDLYTNTFRANLVTASGVNTVGVLSTTGSSITTVYEAIGCMKFSPNGKKVAVAINQNSPISSFELYDFDNSTGAVSNSLSLGAFSYAYGCEFSPDGSKLYGTCFYTDAVYQWDLCAGSPAAVVASQYTAATLPTGGQKGTLQLAMNGKMYHTYYGINSLGVINNPNGAGALCNYVNNGFTVTNGVTLLGLPNFITSFFNEPIQGTFTQTLSPGSCNTASFTSPALPCAGTGNAPLGIVWNFGDAASGPGNTSTSQTPVHLYNMPGTYTTQLIIYYPCGTPNDTLQQPIVIPGPSVTITSSAITCASLGSATASISGGIAPFSYTWMPGGQTAPVAVGLGPGNHSLIVSSNNGNCVSTYTTNFISPVPLSGSVLNGSVSCFGASTATAAVVNLAGGSGNQAYNWANGSVTYTTAIAGNLNAGTWSLTLTDLLTACQLNQSFNILQAPSMSLTITSNTPTVCAGGSIVLTGSNSGGTPGYNYSWFGGPANSAFTITPANSGTYIFTLSSIDANTCAVSNTISISTVSNPTLSVNSITICPAQTGSLNVSGASSYTWNNGITGSTFTANPVSTTIYTVTGTLSGCTVSSTGTMMVNSVPAPSPANNGPLCEGQQLLLNASGGLTYLWSGPLSFTSSVQNPTIPTVGINNTGIYSVTITAANSCTSAGNTLLSVNPIPTVTVADLTVCLNQTANFSAVAPATSSYTWTGPMGFLSNLPNPVINSVTVNQAGNYTLSVQNASGCVNTATFALTTVQPPNLSASLSSNSLCAQALGGSPNTITLSANGATSYTISTPNHIYNPNPAGPNSPLSMLPPFQPTGPATATLNGSNGVCSLSTTAVFTIVPNPTLSIVNPTPVICAGQSYTYTSQGATSYTWSSLSPGSTLYTSGNVAVANPGINSVFSVLGGSLGCNSALQTLTLTVNPLPLITVNPDPAVVCAGHTLQLFANGTGTLYTWYPSLYLNTTNGASVVASPPTNQNYLIVSSLNSCTASAILPVSVLPAPTASILAGKNRFCLNELLSLKGSGGVSYSWIGPGGFTASGSDMEFVLTSPSYSGVYTLTVTDQNNCTGNAEQLITVYNEPGGYFELSGLNGCAPFCSSLHFKTSATSASLTNLSWQLNYQNFSGNHFNYCFTTPGNYIISGSLTDVNSCVSTVSTMVTVHKKPKADFAFYPELPIENLEEVTFTNISEGDAITDMNWHFINNKGYRASGQTTNYLFQNTGVYPIALVIKDAHNCMDTLVKSIQVQPDFSLYVPDAFSPNNDGLNDMFRPSGYGISAYSLEIYDRWGEMVFKSNELPEGWDGSFKGLPAKTDIYNWKISATSHQGKTKNVTGHVALIR